jgi:hypothetical protein
LTALDIMLFVTNGIRSDAILPLGFDYGSAAWRGEAWAGALWEGFGLRVPPGTGQAPHHWCPYVTYFDADRPVAELQVWEGRVYLPPDDQIYVWKTWRPSGEQRVNIAAPPGGATLRQYQQANRLMAAFDALIGNRTGPPPGRPLAITDEVLMRVGPLLERWAAEGVSMKDVGGRLQSLEAADPTGFAGAGGKHRTTYPAWIKEFRRLKNLPTTSRPQAGA